MQPNQAQPVPVYPEPAAPQGPQPSQPAPPVESSGKVSLNPFTHLFSGAYNLLTSNLVSSLLAAIIWFVIFVIMEVVFLMIFLGMIFSGLGSGRSFSPVDIIGAVIAFMIVLTLLGSFFGSVLSRLVVTGARKQRVSLGEGFAIAKNRFRITVLTMLMIAGAMFIAGVALALLLAVLSSALGFVSIIIGIIAVVAAVILYLRYSYVPFVLVDDVEPTGIGYAFQRSRQLWFKSGGALIVYGIVVTVFLIVLSTVISSSSLSESKYTQSELGTSSVSRTTPTYRSGSLDQPPTPDYTTPTYTQPTKSSAGISIGVAILSAVASTAISIFIWAGMAKIYNDAQELVDGKTAGDDMVGPAVATDNTSMPDAPTTPIAPTPAVTNEAQPPTPPAPPAQ